MLLDQEATRQHRKEAEGKEETENNRDVKGVSLMIITFFSVSNSIKGILA